MIPFLATTALDIKQRLRYSAQHRFFAPTFSLTVMSVYGLPTATIKLLALVMTVLKTLGLHITLG